MTTARGAVYIATSLDGFIARADGGIDFLSRVEVAGEDYGYREFFASVDALVMGKRTYDTVIAFDPWPYAGKRMVVLTSQSGLASRHGEEFYAGELYALFERLGTDGVRRVYVDGGNVIGQALRAGLVDEVTVSVIPVLLGAGTPLAPALTSDVPLELTGHRAFPSGLVQLTYRTTRA